MAVAVVEAERRWRRDWRRWEWGATAVAGTAVEIDGGEGGGPQHFAPHLSPRRCQEEFGVITGGTVIGVVSVRPNCSILRVGSTDAAAENMRPPWRFLAAASLILLALHLLERPPRAQKAPALDLVRAATAAAARHAGAGIDSGWRAARVELTAPPTAWACADCVLDPLVYPDTYCAPPQHVSAAATTTVVVPTPARLASLEPYAGVPQASFGSVLDALPSGAVIGVLGDSFMQQALDAMACDLRSEGRQEEAGAHAQTRCRRGASASAVASASASAASASHTHTSASASAVAPPACVRQASCSGSVCRRRRGGCARTHASSATPTATRAAAMAREDGGGGSCSCRCSTTRARWPSCSTPRTSCWSTTGCTTASRRAS